MDSAVELLILHKVLHNRINILVQNTDMHEGREGNC